MPGKLKTKETVQADLDRLFGLNSFTLVGDYKGTTERTEFKHSCGRTFTTTPFVLKTGGKKCECQKTQDNYERGYFNGTIKSTQQVQNELNKHFGSQEYTFLDEYRGNDGYSDFEHSCGLTITAKARALKSGAVKCPCLHKRKYKLTLEQYNQTLNKPMFICKEYSGNWNELNTYQHLDCSKTFQRSARHFKAITHCPVCKPDAHKTIHLVSKEQAQSRLDKAFPKEYKIGSNYESLAYRCDVKHLECNTVYETIVSNMFFNSGLCPLCYKSGNKLLKHKGRNYKVQGYEDRTLINLLKKYKMSDITLGSSGKVPRFEYKYLKVRARYNPDFYIQSTNTIIEVKGKLTMGLMSKQHEKHWNNGLMFKRNQAKARAVIRKGFKFEMHLYLNKTNKHPVKLPDNWYTMSKSALLKYLKGPNLEYIRPRFTFYLANAQ